MNEDNVLNFTGKTVNDLSPKTILNNINFDELDHVIIIAVDKEGFSRAYSSMSDASGIMYLIEKFKFNLLNGVYG